MILYGSPGTGKTLLAKAVANQTSATFLRVVGSELIQKYLGDGPKMVRELFRVAEEHAPVRSWISTIFFFFFCYALQQNFFEANVSVLLNCIFCNYSVS